MRFVIRFKHIRKNDIKKVGGKNANIGELMHIRVPVPDGFAITASAYKYFLRKNNLNKLIKRELGSLNTGDIKKLQQAGKSIRTAIKNADMPPDLERIIIKEFEQLGAKRVAVRSSATAEDLPGASFAGQQETYLNIGKNDLINRVKDCFASLFTDRAISYRADKGFDHFKVFLSVGVQKMVNSQCSGVAFTLDPDTGWDNVVVINGSWGLGDYIVQGHVTPDEFCVFKPTLGIIKERIATKKIMEIRTKSGVGSGHVPKNKQNKPVLTKDEIRQLAKYCIKIEKHYKHPQDVEWAKDSTGLYIVQARPETVQSPKPKDVLERYVLEQRSRVIVTGQAIGQKIVTGQANVIKNVKGIKKFMKGQVLVTEMTDPDWEPIMKIASGIITEKGGRTSHAAIVSRELGIPAIIGAEHAMRRIRQGQTVTMDCTSEPGKVWAGKLKYRVVRKRIKSMPITRTKIFVNIGIPEEALEASRFPVDGVGLARLEFIINSYIREHPLAMIKQGRGSEFTNKLAEGVAQLVAPFYPREVIVRLSDFKSNEYANLRGGKEFEPAESNPMIGWRGASRYIDPLFEPAFRLECRALKKVRDEMGLTNLTIMIPFCRTVKEAKKTLSIMKQEGLTRKNTNIIVMAEIPSNVILVDKFNKLFDGYSIGTNDLAQLVLGMDRDSEKLAKTADERDEAVLRIISMLIRGAHKDSKKVGICGQAPSDFPEFTRFLVKNRVDSISVNPDVAVKTKLLVARIEKNLKKKCLYKPYKNLPKPLN